LMLLHETSQGTFSHVFDLDSTELDEMDKDNPVNSVGSTKSSSNPPSRKAKEGRFPVNPGITGFVAATGETINIANAYEDNRFDPTVDEKN